jgi:hypothetical protein
MLRRQQVDLESAELICRMTQRPVVSCCNAPPKVNLMEPEKSVARKLERSVVLESVSAIKNEGSVRVQL